MSCEKTKVEFEHDGSPFTSSDLTALLSGGSNKDFESDKTTGRFGTGFLVTHVLAETTRLNGLLQTPTGHERFDGSSRMRGESAIIRWELESARSDEGFSIVGC